MKKKRKYTPVPLKMIVQLFDAHDEISESLKLLRSVDKKIKKILVGTKPEKA